MVRYFGSGLLNAVQHAWMCRIGGSTFEFREILYQDAGIDYGS